MTDNIYRQRAKTKTYTTNRQSFQTTVFFRAGNNFYELICSFERVFDKLDNRQLLCNTINVTQVFICDITAQWGFNCALHAILVI